MTNLDAENSQSSDFEPPEFRLPPPSTVVRPGISQQFLGLVGICEVTGAEAEPLVGKPFAGIYIPYPGVMDTGPEGPDGPLQPYGRLRLNRPIGDMKYYQRKGTGPHVYITPLARRLYRGDTLVMVEGEFKSLALCEDDIPAVGVSGFYSWRTGEGDDAALTDEFRTFLEQVNPQRIAFIGDADTALNWQFSDAAVSLRRLTNIEVILPRIQYQSPQGKGVDDIKAFISQQPRSNTSEPDTRFRDYISGIIATAVVVGPELRREDLMFQLIDRARTDITALVGAARNKAYEKLTKCGEALSSAVDIDLLTRTIVPIFGVQPSAVKQDIKRARKKLLQKLRRANGDAEEDDGFPDEPQRPEIEPDPRVFEEFYIIGKEYYSYSYARSAVGIGERSDILTVCPRKFVERSLFAAGYDHRYPTPEDPVFGEVPGMSLFSAAMLYLERTRCKAMVYRLFRPYGLLQEPDKTFVFNNSRAQPIQPKLIPNPGCIPNVLLPDSRTLSEEEFAQYVDKIHDVLVSPLYIWLLNLFMGHQQLEHFMSLLSYAYCGAVKGEPKKTRAIFLVGPPDSGKSLLIDWLLPRIFGQTSAADTLRLFRGEMGAGTTLGSYVCKLSDRELGDAKDVRKIQNGMLSFLADHTTSSRLLYSNETTEEVINLFVFSSNPDGSVSLLLKDMPQSVKEKLAVYECGLGIKLIRELYGDLADGEDLLKNPSKYFEPYLEDFCTILRLWNDLDMYQSSKYRDARFGVAAHFPPKLSLEHSLSNDEELLVQLLIGKKFENKRSSEIYQELRKDAKIGSMVGSMRPSAFTKMLRTIADTHEGLVTYREYEKNGRINNRLFTVTGKAFAKETAPPAGRAKTRATEIVDEDFGPNFDFEKFNAKLEADIAAGLWPNIPEKYRPKPRNRAALQKAKANPAEERS